MSHEELSPPEFLDYTKVIILPEKKPGTSMVRGIQLKEIQKGVSDASEGETETTHFFIKQINENLDSLISMSEDYFKYNFCLNKLIRVQN